MHGYQLTLIQSTLMERCSEAKMSPQNSHKSSDPVNIRTIYSLVGFRHTLNSPNALMGYVCRIKYKPNLKN